MEQQTMESTAEVLETIPLVKVNQYFFYQVNEHTWLLLLL